MNINHREYVSLVEEKTLLLLEEAESYLKYLKNKKNAQVGYSERNLRSIELAIKECYDLIETIDKIVLDRLMRIKDRQIILDRFDEED